MPAETSKRPRWVNGSLILLLSFAQNGNSFVLRQTRIGILPPCDRHVGFSGPKSDMIDRRLDNFPLHDQFRRSNYRWDGDDLRWGSRLRRRWLGSIRFELSNPSMSTAIVLTTLMIYMYQAYNSVYWIRKAYPSSWSSAAPSILLDTLLGSARAGPFTTGLCCYDGARSPFRYLTAGFLHSSIFHWALTMDLVRRLPSWVEELGKPRFLLYLTTFLVAVVGGNLAHRAEGWIVGASGGVAGLYGLMYVSMIRMANSRATFNTLKGAGRLFLYGCLVERMSNASHFGGFLSGIAMGIVAGPRYRTVYNQRRKNTLASASPDISREYGTAMGYDKRPTNGLLPLWVVWVALFICLYLRVPQVFSIAMVK